MANLDTIHRRLLANRRKLPAHIQDMIYPIDQEYYAVAVELRRAEAFDKRKRGVLKAELRALRDQRRVIIQRHTGVGE